MAFLVIVPGIGSREWPTRDDAEQSLATAHALGLTDAWMAMIPDADELDGTAGEGCGA